MIPRNEKRELSIVVPVYNENETIQEFFRRTKNAIDNLNCPNWSVSLILVNDGSNDSTAEQLEELIRETNSFSTTVVTLSRNFGHQQAVWAGIENSDQGSCILVMDADLQDPPEMLGDFLRGLEEYDVIIARRKSRDDSLSKRFFAQIFYKIAEKLSGGTVRANVGDFWALSERAKSALLEYREELKFLRGLISELGFPVKVLQYDRDARYAGKTKYSLLKMIQLAIAGVTGFTIQPLIYTVYVAIVVSLLLFPAAIFLAWSRFIGESVISPGLTFVGIVVIISIGLQFAVLSVLALYIARIAIEVKKRPVYILDNIIKKNGRVKDESGI